MAARLALAGKATRSPRDRRDRRIDPALCTTRASAVKARSAAMAQLSQLIITAPQQLREQLAVRRSIRGKATLCRRLRPARSKTKRETIRCLKRYIERATPPSSHPPHAITCGAGFVGQTTKSSPLDIYGNVGARLSNHRTSRQVDGRVSGPVGSAGG